MLTEAEKDWMAKRDIPCRRCEFGSELLPKATGRPWPFLLLPWAAFFIQQDVSHETNLHHLRPLPLPHLWRRICHDVE